MHKIISLVLLAALLAPLSTSVDTLGSGQLIDAYVTPAGYLVFYQSGDYFRLVHTTPEGLTDTPVMTVFHPGETPVQVRTGVCDDRVILAAQWPDGEIQVYTWLLPESTGICETRTSTVYLSTVIK